MDIDINILFTKRSPFILSDLPKQNILYLENGQTTNEADSIKKNTFAANIGDLLHQSFFLKNGFIGAKAQEKLTEIYKILFLNNANIPYKKLSNLIDMIGDDLLREQFKKSSMSVFYLVRIRN